MFPPLPKGRGFHTEDLDEKNDLAVLKVSEEEIPFQLGNSETVKKRARICAIGYDGDKENSAAATVQGEGTRLNRTD